ncbi:hypothetical protein BDQ12DRAFT_400404 [Crucibulum laeve]|uniref:Uncharacterized protein n=1 Tax=Crucibulum laeve TaxID=68775 RepID=A0A5C3LLB4_9AGAR|nr:hypothetical protein BDQ12DRAFT_400404 [Crucibulum laeve]
MLDTHSHSLFGGPMLDLIMVPDDGGMLEGKWPKAACDTWGPMINQSRQASGVTFAGEFSGSPNHCGLFLRGVGTESTNHNDSSTTIGRTLIVRRSRALGTLSRRALIHLEIGFSGLGRYFGQDRDASLVLLTQPAQRVDSYRRTHHRWGMCWPLPLPYPSMGMGPPMEKGRPDIQHRRLFIVSLPLAAHHSQGSVSRCLSNPTYTNTRSVTIMLVQTYSSVSASVTKSVDG